VGRLAEELPSPIAADQEPEADRLRSAQWVADVMGVGVDYVWALCRANEIPHIRLGRAKRFRPSAVRAWLAEREQGGSS
jgi:excisionase family DNA binding protein